MTPISVHVLYNEFMADLNTVRKKLVEHPSDEVGLHCKTMLDRDLGVIAGWMKEHSHDAAPAGKDLSSHDFRRAAFTGGGRLRRDGGDDAPLLHGDREEENIR